MIERDDPRDADLAARYRAASREEPSAGLDARILAAARATATPPKAAAAARTQRWTVPVVLAALAVMTTTLTLLVQDEEAARLEQPASVAPPSPPKAPTAPDAKAPEGPKASAAPAVVPPVAPAAKPAEARGKEAATPRVEAEAPASELARAANESLEKRTAPSPATTDALGSGAASPRRADSTEDATGKSPEQWVAEIRKLRLEGRTAEAEASLAELRKRYPAYLLPDDLKQP